jgi:thioredoxin reductase (NADPH)
MPAEGTENIKPAIVALVSEAKAALLARELSNRYAADYSISTDTSSDAALNRLQELAIGQNDVALILADFQMGGEELLAAGREIHPHARKALLLEWGEHRIAREELVRAIAFGQADYFVVEPLASPDERFHRSITEFLDEWWRLRGIPFEAIRVIGKERSARSHEICDLLQRHDLPYGFYGADSDAGRQLLDDAGLGDDRLPVVIVGKDRRLVEPTNIEVAEALGARTQAGSGIYDVAIVGGGPAGLSAAVSAASEGLRTALIERQAMGGQAGTSSSIRNYLGFPRGISGAELAARALEQAILFGTELIYGGEAISIRVDGDLRIVALSNGAEVVARTVVIATGVSYRMLGIPSLETFSGAGVFYGAALSEARSLAGEQIFVVGGGNSAGQAAIHLAKFASRVTILVRSDSLAQSMSEYLVTAIDATPNINVRYGVELAGGGGDRRLQWLTLKDRHSGRHEDVHAAALCVFIGAEPFTDWLPPSIARDKWGYVLTGVFPSDSPPNGQPAEERLVFETTLPNVFAVGDARHGSIKRVASAAGEGSVCIRLVHECLSRLPSGEQRPAELSS